MTTDLIAARPTKPKCPESTIKNVPYRVLVWILYLHSPAIERGLAGSIRIRNQAFCLEFGTKPSRLKASLEYLKAAGYIEDVHLDHGWSYCRIRQPLAG